MEETFIESFAALESSDEFYDLPNEASTFGAAARTTILNQICRAAKRDTRQKSKLNEKETVQEQVAVCVSLLWVPACVLVFFVVSSCVDFCGAFPWFFQPAQRCPTVYQGMTRKAKRTFKERLSSVEKRLSRPKESPMAYGGTALQAQAQGGLWRTEKRLSRPAGGAYAS